MKKNLLKIFASFAITTWIGLVGIAYVLLGQTTAKYKEEVVANVHQMTAAILDTQAKDLQYRVKSLLINKSIGNALLLANEVDDHEVFLQTIEDVSNNLGFDHLIVLDRQQRQIFPTDSLSDSITEQLRALPNNLKVLTVSLQENIAQCAQTQYTLYGENAGTIMACNYLHGHWIDQLEASTDTKIYLSKRPGMSNYEKGNITWRSINPNIVVGVESAKPFYWILLSLIVGTLVAVVGVVIILRIHMRWLKKTMLDRLNQYTEHLRKSQMALEQNAWRDLTKVEIECQPADEIFEMAKSYNLGSCLDKEVEIRL